MIEQIDKKKLLEWVEAEITESNEVAMKWVAYNVMKGKFDDHSVERESDILRTEHTAMKEALERISSGDYSMQEGEESYYDIIKKVTMTSLRKYSPHSIRRWRND